MDIRLNLLQNIVNNQIKLPNNKVNFKPTDVLINKMNYKKIIELGVRDGKHFEQFVKSNADEIIGVDLWLDSENIYENDKKFSQEKQDLMYNNLVNKYSQDSRVKLIKHDSSSLSSKYDDSYFDLVFVDADHSYEGSKKDINMWYNKVRSGGILCGHDYEDFGVNIDGKYYKFGVIKAVNEFVKNNNLEDKLFVTPKKGNLGGGIPCWYILK